MELDTRSFYKPAFYTTLSVLGIVIGITGHFWGINSDVAEQNILLANNRQKSAEDDLKSALEESRITRQENQALQMHLTSTKALLERKFDEMFPTNQPGQGNADQQITALKHELVSLQEELYTQSHRFHPETDGYVYIGMNESGSKKYLENYSFAKLKDQTITLTSESHLRRNLPLNIAGEYLQTSEIIDTLSKDTKLMITESPVVFFRSDDSQPVWVGVQVVHPSNLHASANNL